MGQDWFAANGFAPSSDRSQWDKRADGSAKGDGFLGVLKRPDGQVSSEISIGINLDGKNVEIPTLVPTLSPQERDWLINNDVSDPRKLPRPIVDKAVAFARERQAQGKPFFAQAGEGPAPAAPQGAPQGGDWFSSNGFTKTVNASPLAHPLNIDDGPTPQGSGLMQALTPLAHPATAEDFGNLVLAGDGGEVVGKAIGKVTKPIANAVTPLIDTAAKYGGALRDVVSPFIPHKIKAGLEVLSHISLPNNPLTIEGREAMRQAAVPSQVERYKPNLSGRPGPPEPVMVETPGAGKMATSRTANGEVQRQMADGIDLGPYPEPAITADQFHPNTSGFDPSMPASRNTTLKVGAPSGPSADPYLPNTSGYTPGSGSNNTTLRNGPSPYVADPHMANTSGFDPSAPGGVPHEPFPMPDPIVDRWSPNTSGYVPGEAPIDTGPMPTAIQIERYMPNASGFEAGGEAATSHVPYGTPNPAAPTPAKRVSKLDLSSGPPRLTGTKAPAMPTVQESLQNALTEAITNGRDVRPPIQVDPKSVEAFSSTPSEPGHWSPAIENPRRMLPGFGETNETWKPGGRTRLLLPEKTLMQLVNELAQDEIGPGAVVRNLKAHPSPVGEDVLSKALRQRKHIYDTTQANALKNAITNLR